MIIHIEPDIQEHEVKWALGSITMNKASGGDGMPGEVFQILKDESAALSMPANLETSAVSTGMERSVFVTTPKKGNVKECSNYHTIALISHTSKVILKILQARLQQYVNCELPDVQGGFRKGKEPEITLPTSIGSSKKQERVPEKCLLLLYWLCKSF